MRDLGNGFIDAAVHPERQAVSGGVDGLQHGVQVVTLVTQHMQHRAEHLALQALDAVDFNQGRHHKMPLACALVACHACHLLAVGLHACDVLFNLGAGLLVDHRTHIGVHAIGVAHDPFTHGLFEHVQHAVGHVFLNTQQAQGRATLASRIKRRRQHVAHHLLSQCRRIHHQGILTTSLGNQRDAAALRAQTLGQGVRNQPRHLGRAGEHDTRHLRMRHQCRTHNFARAGHQLHRIRGHPGFVQDLDHHVRHQRGLLGRLGEHTVATGQRRRHLAGKNRQREIPRADAQHHTQGAMGLVVKGGLHLSGVITQKVDRLADFRNGIGQ